MISVRINEDDLFEMLMNRLKTWTDDDNTIELFEQYYDHMVYGGCFDGANIDIMAIVDNDYVNNTFIVERSEYEKNRAEFIRNKVKEFIKDNKDCYDDEEKEDYIESLKNFIEDIKEEAPEFDDLEVGENNLEFLNGYYIEAKTDNSLLMS